MIKDIKVGIYETFVFLGNNTLWGCGKNSYGKLGTNHTNQINAFIKVCDGIEKVENCSDATFFLKKNGTVWFAGDNSYLGKKGNVTSLIKIADSVKDILYWELSEEKKFLFCLKNNGDLLDLTKHKIYSSDVKRIFTGNLMKNPCLFIIKKDNSLLYFDGQKSDKLGSFGNVKNVFSSHNSPVFIHRTDDSLWKIKEDNFKKEIKIFDDIKDVKTFEKKSLFLKKNGELFVLGENLYGEFGIDQTRVDTPTLVAKDVKEIYCTHLFTLILKNDNSLWGCGRNYYNILEDKPKDYNFYSFKKICDDVKKVYLYRNTLFIIKQNDELWSSGKMAVYFQGNNYLRFISNDIKDVFFDSDSFFFLKKNDILLCFGDNKWGQLGIGSRKDWIDTPVKYTAFKKYYDIYCSTKETVKVIKDVFKKENLW